MDNENISNSLQIVFDANNNVHYDSEQTDNTQQPATVTQSQQQEVSETEEGKELEEDNSRKFRGVNWDDYSTNHLLDIYQRKFPLLESTPHNKGRKQIYEEVRNEFNSNENIRNKRTLKSMTRKWGEMLAKYRIRRGIEDRTGKLPDNHWDYHERMHEIVGHLPTNGRLAFPITNTVVDPATNQLTTTTVTASTTPSTNTSNKSSNNNKKRTRPDDLDKDTHNDGQHHRDNIDHNTTNSESDEATISTSPSSNIHSITPHPRPIQPKAPVQSTMAFSQQQQQQQPSSSTSSPSSKQPQTTTTSHTAKVPRRIEPKRNTTSNNENNNEKGQGETTAFIPTLSQRGYRPRTSPFSVLKKPSLVSPSPPPSSSPSAAAAAAAAAVTIQNEHGHDIRNTIDQILEAGERLNELMAAESNSTRKSISDSLSLIADSSKQMAESNRLLAQQIENNTKTTAALLEAMKALAEGLNNRNLDSDGS